MLKPQFSVKLLKKSQKLSDQLKDSINANKTVFKHLILYSDSTTTKELYLDTLNNKSLLVISNDTKGQYSWYYLHESLQLLECKVNSKQSYLVYFKNAQPILFYRFKRRTDLVDLNNYPELQQAINYGTKALSVFLSPLGIQ